MRRYPSAQRQVFGQKLRRALGKWGKFPDKEPKWGQKPATTTTTSNLKSEINPKMTIPIFLGRFLTNSKFLIWKLNELYPERIIMFVNICMFLSVLKNSKYTIKIPIVSLNRVFVVCFVVCLSVISLS